MPARAPVAVAALRRLRREISLTVGGGEGLGRRWVCVRTR
jgi:hypothetical protein